MEISEVISAQNEEAEPLPGGDEAIQGDEDEGAGQDQGDTAAGDEDQESEDAVSILTAIYPILYLSHQYKVGDELPANDPRMVEAWLSSGTAAWIRPVQKGSMAKLMTAEPGLPGQALPSEAEDGDDLVGKVPKKRARRKR